MNKRKKLKWNEKRAKTKIDMLWTIILIRIISIRIPRTKSAESAVLISWTDRFVDPWWFRNYKSLPLVTSAKRLRQKVQDLEKELSEQKLVNQQQTLILLELIKVTNLNVQGIHFNLFEMPLGNALLPESVFSHVVDRVRKRDVCWRHLARKNLKWIEDVSMSRNRRFNGLKITSNILSLLMSSQGEDFLFSKFWDYRYPIMVKFWSRNNIGIWFLPNNSELHWCRWHFCYFCCGA